MDFTNPVPTSNIPKFHEASPMRSKRDSEALTAHWRKEQKAAARAAALTRNMALMNRNIARIRRNVGGTGTDVTTIRVYLCGDGINEAGYYLLNGMRDPNQDPA